MKIDRDAFTAHLSRIMCNGQINEVVFTDAFTTAALTADHLLLVLAPGMSDVPALDEGIGVPDLLKLSKALDIVGGDGTDPVDVTLTDGRLVLDGDYRGVIRLLTAAPKTIATRIEDATIEKFRTGIPDIPGVPITRNLVDGITETFKLVKASEIEFFFGPDGGKIRVGSETSDVAEFGAGDLKADEEFSLLFGKHIVDVLGIIRDYSSAVMKATGPGNFLTVQDGEYTYLLSPRSRGSDE